MLHPATRWLTRTSTISTCRTVPTRSTAITCPSHSLHNHTTPQDRDTWATNSTARSRSCTHSIFREGRKHTDPQSLCLGLSPIPPPLSPVRSTVRFRLTREPMLPRSVEPSSEFRRAHSIMTPPRPHLRLQLSMISYGTHTTVTTFFSGKSPSRYPRRTRHN